MKKLTTKQRIFLETYLACWNATEAARVAGYKHPNTQGPRLLVNVRIREAVEERLKVKALEADEVLQALSEIAAGSMADFTEIDDEGGIRLDMNKAKLKRKLQIVKKLKFKDGVLESIELYDRQAALVQLGRHYQLFTDKVLVDWRTELEQSGISAGDAFEQMVQKMQQGMVEGSDNGISTRDGE